MRRERISLRYKYHVIFGAGNASQASDNVPFCPRSTLVSVRDCVMLRGAREYKEYSADHSFIYLVD